MTDLQKIADAVNTLAAWLGPRDVPDLANAGADLMVLFGGSILHGGDVLAAAMRAGAARRYAIVGGAGHTTETLRAQVRALCPGVDTENKPEAEIFAAYLQSKYGLTPDLLETQSTNCGNNVTLLLPLLDAAGLAHRTVILTQDATMQRRMQAVWNKHAPQDRVINYAAYQNPVRVQNGALAFERALPGMWDMERYITLLMGEIPRLTDDADGYGPNGKGFLAHVDVPEPVQAAFALLKAHNAALVRPANPAFAG